jgi:hypothetical protein
MVNAIYQHRSDNVARATAAITVGTGTAPSGYGPTLLVDENPARVAKITAGTAAWVFDFGTAQRVDLAALIHHNFDTGGDVRLQGNATNSWGAPTFSAAFVIPTWQAAGTPTRWPVNPWMDVSAQSGYSAGGFRYWRVVITGNSQNVELGQVWLSPTIRRLTVNMESGQEEARNRGLVRNTTSFDVDTIYPRHNPRWSTVFALPTVDQTLRTALQQQWDDVGGQTYPWLLVPNGDMNACYLVRWSMPEERLKRLLLGPGAAPRSVSQSDCSIMEVARGLRPGT